MTLISTWTTSGILVLSLMFSGPPSLPSGHGDEPSRPTAEGQDAFFHGALEKAKIRLDDGHVAEIMPVSTRAAEPAVAMRTLPAPAVALAPTSDPGVFTCTTQTCQNYPTCNGGATVCSNTCGNYPTCNGTQATWCQNTCGGGASGGSFPTCTTGTNTCSSTCSGYPTCNGDSPTSCSSTCDSYPTCTGDAAATCTQTCNGSDGSYPTCGGSAPTACGQETCMDYPTCTGSPPACTPTQAFYPTCNGEVATSCTWTCRVGRTAWPTCDKTCTNYPTCNGSTATVCTYTCHPSSDGDGGGDETQPGDYPTCVAGSATCAASQQTCKSTCENWPTCNGGSAPPTRCADTCAGHPECFEPPSDPDGFQFLGTTALAGLLTSLGLGLAFIRPRSYLPPQA